MKTIKQMLMTIAVLLCSVAANAHDFVVGGIYYNINGSEVAVTYKGEWSRDYDNEYTGNIVIPSTVNHNGKTYKVTSIGNDAFTYCNGLTSVKIGNSVTSIGESAFEECRGLRIVTIGNSVESIGWWAFKSCIKLEIVIIGSSVTSIGDAAFYNCGLKTVINFSNLQIYYGINNGLGSADEVINYPNGSIEGDYLFAKIDDVNTLCYYVGNTKNLSLPENYKGGNYVIGNSAFALYNSGNLTSITIPNSVTSIGDYAFSGCYGLTSITIPNSVTSIGKWAFYGCRGLTSITIPNSVTSIEERAFSGCYGLTSITIPNSVTSIGNSAFYGSSGLTSITIPNSVTSIGDDAFHNCTALNTLIYHSKCSILSNIFTRCDNLSDIFYTSQLPPSSLLLSTNTYVPNKEIYAKSTVSAGSGNFIEYISFQGANATYGETPNIVFVNNLETVGYTATATMPSISTNAGTYTIDIPFTFTKGNNDFDVSIPYKYKIDKAPLVVKADSVSRFYGDNNPEFSISYSGFVNGEDESVLTKKGNATTSATAKSDVGIYDIVISGVTAENYEIQYKKGSLIVNKVPLTVAVNNATKVYGDNNPKFTLKYSGLKNNETSPKMVSAIDITTDATKLSNVGEYDITISGGEAKNYEIINYTNGKLTVTKAPLTVTANNATKTYGDGNPSFDFSCVGLKNDDTASTIFSKNPILTCYATNYSDTGNYDIIVSGGEAYNYNVTNYANGTLSVTKAPLTISANNCTRIYGDENPAFEYNCIGLRNSDNPNEIFETKPQTICSATAKSAVGEYDINIIGGAAKNYYIVNNEKGVLTIEKAQLTAIVKNLSRVYGDENPEWILSYYGLKNGETSPEMLTAFNITTDATKLSNVGEYDIALSGGEAKNYEIVNYTNGKLAVTKAPLTVTAKNFTKIYGSINPEFKYSYNGAKNNDSEGAIFETLPTISCAADETSNVGVYEIEIGDASSNNYEISYKSGILSVNKREITVSTKNYTRIYGAENPNFEILYNGFVNNEDESVLLIKPKAKTNADKDSDVGTYDITIEGGDDDNYSFAYSCGTLTIEKANQTITWEQEFDDLVVGSQIELTAKASSGLDIEYIIPDNNFLSVYTIGGSTYLDCYDAGEIVIRATQNGNKNYNASVRVSKVVKIVPTGINSASADAMVKIDGNYITVSSANNSMVAVYTVNGALVEKIDSYAGEEISLDKGVYIVRVGNKTIKVNI